MISRRELGRKPEIPLATEEQVGKALQEKIEDFCERIRKESKPSKSPSVKRDRELFRLEAGKEWVTFTNKQGQIIGQIGQDRLQALALEYLTLYGLESDKPGSVNELSLPDGTSTETTIYQSTCIENLRFVSQLRQDKAGQMISVTWFLRNWTL